MRDQFTVLANYYDQLDYLLLHVCSVSGLVFDTNESAKQCLGESLIDYCAAHQYVCPVSQLDNKIWHIAEGAKLCWTVINQVGNSIWLVGDRWMEQETKQHAHMNYLDCLPFSIFKKDLQGCYTWINQFQRRRLQQTCVGKTDAQLCWAQYASVLRKNDQKVMKKRRVITFEEVICDAHGKLHRSYTTKMPIYDEKNTVIGIMGFSVPASVSLEATDIMIKPMFTSMELKCLYWLTWGKSAEDIGGLLHKSPRTIEDILSNIKKKVGVKKLYQLGHCFAALQTSLQTKLIQKPLHASTQADPLINEILAFR